MYAIMHHHAMCMQCAWACAMQYPCVHPVGMCAAQRVTRKTRILDVVYNASNNELVSSKHANGWQ